mmetsp:Transcript_12511/g.35346  ORF Transcript_12511/g.35346 Transcript_12511/m.35346 type:complete len:166 (+) Transcript_12511:151-648(+)|eukprot:CAMPEP_0119129258 /NCGR_PEP_ID=MMETSP1310-20130426/7089_1 /TAXON_ID=464262 /ORGANISM="Genus nov. species nov., Strain RCC2339" /LENGTH=165 /DNA_ID=CAMNT_0007119675 /DNA_START=136 /DNA_END=633 /DNA_ORIENTATION=+
MDLKRMNSETLILESDTAKRAPVGEKEAQHVQCGNISEVKAFLKASRKYVDNFKYHLNRTGPGVQNESKLECDAIWREARGGFTVREDLLNRCVAEMTDEVAGLRSALGEGENDELEQELFQAELNLRHYNSEFMSEKMLFNGAKSQYKKQCREEFFKMLREGEI